MCLIFSAFLDFTSEVKVVTFPPSESSFSIACTTVEVLEDKLAFEGSESFTVAIESIEAVDVTSVTVGSNFTSEVIIQDNDGESNSK